MGCRCRGGQNIPITPSAENSSVDGQSQAYDVGGSQGQGGKEKKAHKSRRFEAETREELVKQTQVVKCILHVLVSTLRKSLIGIFCTSPGFDILPRYLHPR
ncbi:hypothetical protein Ac2012v2_007675 [Leucoagaricus gongylophorus]